MNAFLLDTHIWIWVQQRNDRELSAEAFEQVEDWQPGGQVFTSAISILEIARLVADGQLYVPASVDRFIAEAHREEGLRLLPLTPKILIDSTRLPGVVPRDPADRLLVATAREHGLTLVTGDKDVLAYGRKGHVSVLKF